MRHSVLGICVILFVLSVFATPVFSQSFEDLPGTEQLNPDQLLRYQQGVALIVQEKGLEDLSRIAPHFYNPTEEDGNSKAAEKALFIADYPEEYLLLQYNAEVYQKYNPAPPSPIEVPEPIDDTEKKPETK